MSIKQSIANNPIVFLLKKMWEYSKGNRKAVVLYMVLSALANIVGLIQPVIIGVVLNNIQNNGLDSGNIGTIILYLSSIIFFSLLFWAFHGPSRVIERNNAFMVRANFRKFLLEGTMNLDASWHADHHSGDTIDKISKGAEALYMFSNRSYEIVEGIIRLVGAYIALMYFNIHASYIVVFTVIMTFSLVRYFDKKLVKQYKVIFGAENKIAAKIYDVISNITTVIILRIERLVLKDMWSKILKPYEISKENNKLNEFKWFLVSLMTSIMTFLTLASFIFVSYKNGNAVMIGTIFILYNYVNRINQIAFHFTYRYGDIVKQKAKVANSMEISNLFTKRKKKSVNILKRGWKNLDIKKMDFSYHNTKGSDLHLDGINLDIKQGEKIAFVGASGSGKTTTLKVMRELYPIKNGSIFLDGKELKQGFKDISSNISLIPQDPEIFTTTIKENITVGINYKQSEVEKYAKLAKFHDVAKRLPNGYDSSVVEKGVNLSGGEKQRLALARGMMASIDKEIVLLDEPTSSIDSKNEFDIYTNIFREFKRKTVISSIHRLHLLNLFDKIYFFSKGKVVTSGKLEDVIKNSSEFKKLWTKYTKTHKN